MNTINDRISLFVEALQALLDKHITENFSNLPKIIIGVKPGKKYVKITCDNRSVYCFIDTTNGDILKPASWKAPAKHARGNIFESDLGIHCCGPYGVAYLR